MIAVCLKALTIIFAAAVLLHSSADAWISTSSHPLSVLQQHLRYSASLIECAVASSLSPDEASSPENSYTHGPQKQSVSEPTPTLAPPSKATLYDILGASPNATRAELKQKYVALAKMTHPDAQRTAPSNFSNGDVAAPQYDFSEIAMAYKILSDTKERRRYDRSIQAEIFTEQIASAVQNHPITELTIKAIGTIAIPLFRTINKVSATSPTTSVTTTTDAVMDSEEMNDSERSATTQNTFKNSFHLKSVAELEREAEKEYKQLLSVQQNLQNIILQRLRVSLHTPQSGLTSNEALMLLDSFQNAALDDDFISEDESGSARGTSAGGRGSNTGISWVERLNFLRSSVEAEISALQNTEMAYMQQQEVSSNAQEVHQTAIQDLISIRKSLIDAEREESNARRMLEQAMEETRRQRNHYERINGQLFAAEHAAALASNELERLQNAILKQSESVRHSLIRKERALLNDSSSNSNSQQAPTNEAKAISSVDKPDPPMSPQAYSFPSRRPRILLTKSPFSPQLLHSSESSMLGPWPKQPFTLSQREHEAMLDSTGVDLSSENTDSFISDDFLDRHTSQMNAPFDGPKIDPSSQYHEKNGIELAELRRQEEDFKNVASALESRISQLLEQVNHLRQQ